VAASGWVLLPAPAEPVIRFEAFGAAKLGAARAEGRTVVVKVTAAWCTECKILDATVYRDADVAAAFAKANVLAMKADVTEWTSPAGLWVRRTYGATAAPPIAMVYAGGGEPAFLVGNYDKAKLIEAIGKAGR
jgi:thiol:disulfide interchange protein